MSFRNIFLFTIVLLGFLFGSLHAFVLEDFSSTNSFKLDSIDSGASSSGSGESGVDGTAFKFNYDLGTGGWAQFYKDYTSIDLSSEGVNSLRFRYKATGSSSNLEIKLTDYDTNASTSSDKIDLKFPLQTDSQWRTITVHFSSFTLFPDGNSAFNIKQVSKIAFAVTALSANSSDRGSGTVWVDKVELFRSATTLIDDFEDGDNTNALGVDNIAIHGGGSGSRQNTLLSGDRVTEYTYNVSTAATNFAWFRVPLRERNFQGYSHVSFNIRGAAGGEVLTVSMEGSVSPGFTGQSKVLISNFLSGGITTSFQEVKIPISTFTQVNISSISAFVIEASSASGSGSGIVYIDDIAFIRNGESTGLVRVLDECDSDFSLTNWEASAHSDASASVQTASDASVPGAKSDNRVYKIDYSFIKSNLTYPSEVPYIIAERPFYLSIAPYSKLNFTYKGTGSSNNIEFKLQDSDDTIWYKKFLQASSTGGEWKTANLSLDQLAFFSKGTDSELNMKKIKKVYFAISKSTGGSGTFSVDSLGSPESGDFITNDASRLISTFKIINNPFSPNGDKVKDECFFVYTLGSQSKVNLKVYGLDGVERKIIFAGDQSAGEQSVSWDGTDSNSEKMDNGIYLYRLEAEGVDNRKDLLVQVIAVLK